MQLVHWGYSLQWPLRSDFGNYYLYARMGWDAGWSSLYDLDIERREWEALGGAAVMPMYPMIYPPPLAWLVAPFALLPVALGFPIWAGLIGALFLLTWSLSAPGPRLARWTHLAAALALYPVIFGLILAQVLLVVLAAVAIAWRLLRAQRDILAGCALVLMVVKPQVAFLVPFALLMAGRPRVFVAWAAGMAAVVAASALSIGPPGIATYAARLGQASGRGSEFLLLPGLTVPGLLGQGLAGRAGQLLVVAITLIAAYRRRHEGPELPVVAGLLGSFLTTPYIHLQDLTALVVAAWIFLRTPTLAWQRWLLLFGYLLLLIPSFVDVGDSGSRVVTAALVPVLLVWLTSMIVRAGEDFRLPGIGLRAARAAAGPPPAP